MTPPSPTAVAPQFGVLPEDLAAKRERLLAILASLERAVVAFSGGVDSAVVAKAAQLALGDRALAVTATSDSLAQGELEAARQLAGAIGIRHRVVETREFDNPDYRRNDPDRCFHCKSELYDHLEALLGLEGNATIVNGANHDDRGDHRPGMAAAAERGVRSPLIEAGLTKPEVRLLAAEWQLPVWDKPASPCLASRVAYGQEVTPERVAMIDQAERLLHALGIRECRVRYHAGDVARIEAPPEDIGRLVESSTRALVAEQLRAMGFRFVALDLEGFRSGSLNRMVEVGELRVLDRPAATTRGDGSTVSRS